MSSRNKKNKAYKSDSINNDWERTNRRKKLFLKQFSKDVGVVSVSCKKVNISRDTFYNWYRKDKKFKKAIDQIRDEVPDVVEDILMKKIMVDQSEKSIHFYLRSRHKKYKPKQIVEVDTKEREKELYFLRSLIDGGKNIKKRARKSKKTG